LGAEACSFALLGWAESVAEAPISAPDVRVCSVAEALGFLMLRRAALVSEPLYSAVDRRAYFLFCGKKKVAKEKATPRSAPGCARSLALLGAPGGCGTRPYGPQTVLADFPRHACVAQRLSGGPRKTAVCDGLRLKERCTFSSARFSGPLGRRRATQALADKGRALSEGQSPELRSPRQRRVAQGTRAAGRRPRGGLLFGYFFLATQEKVRPRVRRGTRR